MTVLRIDLPTSLAKKAGKAGLLKSDAIEGLLRDELERRRSMGVFFGLAKRTSAKSKPTTENEDQATVQAEIEAYRAGKRATRARRSLK